MGVYWEREGERGYTHWAKERYKGIVEKEERGVEFVEELYAMWDMGKKFLKKELIHSIRILLQYESAYYKGDISLIS